jgi:hypothetical protein
LGEGTQVKSRELESISSSLGFLMRPASIDSAPNGRERVVEDKEKVIRMSLGSLNMITRSLGDSCRKEGPEMPLQKGLRWRVSLG